MLWHSPHRPCGTETMMRMTFLQVAREDILSDMERPKSESRTITYHIPLHTITSLLLIITVAWHVTQLEKRITATRIARFFIFGIFGRLLRFGSYTEILIRVLDFFFFLVGDDFELCILLDYTKIFSMFDVILFFLTAWKFDVCCEFLIFFAKIIRLWYLFILLKFR